jgi:hypothetical protein
LEQEHSFVPHLIKRVCSKNPWAEPGTDRHINPRLLLVASEAPAFRFALFLGMGAFFVNPGRRGWPMGKSAACRAHCVPDAWPVPRETGVQPERLGAFIKDCDPYDHVTSVHGHGQFPFRQSTWADFAMFQSWDEHGGYEFMLKTDKTTHALAGPCRKKTKNTDTRITIHLPGARVDCVPRGRQAIDGVSFGK